jgi:hypothetical protein
MFAVTNYAGFWNLREMEELCLLFGLVRVYAG